MNATPADIRRSRLWLVGLAALFFVPLALSFLLYYGTSWRPAGGTQQGELILPPRPLPEVSLVGADGQPTDPAWLKGNWRLVYVGPADCPAPCRAALVHTRQVRLALDKDMTRVARVFLHDGTLAAPAELATEHPDLLAASLAGAAGARLLAEFPGGTAALQNGRLYVVDPLGNLMMSYPDDTPPKGLLKDLERLLKLSHIG